LKPKRIEKSMSAHHSGTGRHLTARLTTNGLALLSLLFAQSPAMANQSLANSKNCMVCHSVDKKLVGPSFREIASRHQGQPGAAELLAAKITKGSTGAWGPVPMPSQPLVQAQEASALAQWILEQR
jgi:cytochrome c